MAPKGWINRDMVAEEEHGSKNRDLDRNYEVGCGFELPQEFTLLHLRGMSRVVY